MLVFAGSARQRQRELAARYQARGTSVHESAAAVESSVRIPFLGNIAVPANPAPEKQRPECRRAGKNQQPKCNAATRRIWIEPLRTGSDKRDCEYKPDTEVEEEGVGEGDGKTLVHNITQSECLRR